MREDAFYVGYLALPRRHRVFLMIALPLSVLGVCVGAAGLALAQPGWGDGFWETGAARDFTGRLSLEPYPMLHTAGEDGEVSYLLVEMGKFGAQGRFEGDAWRDGLAVTVRGRELRRDGRAMIEIDPDHAGLGPGVVEADADPVGAFAPAGGMDEPAMHVGEIVDSKCYLGAMKPGAGRGHKACAALCISGGIPPVFVVGDDEGGRAYFLLADEQGRGLSGPLLEAMKPWVGERVVVRGRTGRIGSWGVLRLGPGAFGGGGG